MNITSNSSAYIIPGIIKNKGTSQYILNVVAQYFNLSIDDIRARTRRDDVVIPRQIAMYLYRKNTRHSQRYIGELLGGYLPSNVHHAERAVESMMLTDYKGVRRDVEALLTMT